MLGMSTFFMPAIKPNDNPYNLPSLLDSDENKLQEILSRLQLDAMAGKSTQGDVNTLYGGGRAGYAFPIGNDELIAGLSGGGYSNKYGKQLNLTGADVSYQQGKNRFGAEYTQNPMEKLLKLIYTRQF